MVVLDSRLKHTSLQKVCFWCLKRASQLKTDISTFRRLWRDRFDAHWAFSTDAWDLGILVQVGGIGAPPNPAAGCLFNSTRGSKQVCTPGIPIIGVSKFPPYLLDFLFIRWLLSALSLRVLPVVAWVSSEYPGFLPHAKDTLVGNWLLFKLALACVYKLAIRWEKTLRPTS